MKRFWRALFCSAVAFAAFAASAGETSKRIEASLLVTGWIEVSPDGSVHDYTLDHADKLTSSVVDLIGKTIATWRFKPIVVDGRPVLARTKMNLRLVALPLDKGLFSARVQGETFGNGESSEWVRYRERKPPRYPIAALRAAAGGTVYLALEVDRDGHVEQVVAQQVDLRETGSESDMQAIRKILATASINAAKNWAFSPPVAGPSATADHWTVTVPVDFNIAGTKPHYGEWDPYVPGPIAPIPWDQDEIVQSHDADALPEGSAFQPDGRFVLLTSQGG